MRLAFVCRAAALSLLAAALLTGCAAHDGAPAPGATTAPRAKTPAAAVPAPLADSVTLALWRFDESGGNRCTDSGPFGLTATAGSDTRTDFGRFRNARTFIRDLQSFAYVPYSPALESNTGFTVEAWVRINSAGVYELQTIAARWSPRPNEQSWVFGVTGQKLVVPMVSKDSPGWFTQVAIGAPVNHLLFGLQPEAAASPRGVFSTSALPRQKWVHVAAACDHDIVRLYIDGRLDGQGLIASDIRPSLAPLEIGCVFDERRLTDFGSELRFDPTQNDDLWYEFDGAIDELRLSNRARHTFDSTRLR